MSRLRPRASRSPSDTLDDAHAKLREYVAKWSAARLADPESRRVWVYTPGRAGHEEVVSVCHEKRDTISGDPILAGFVLELAQVW